MAIAPLFQRFVDDELALAPALVERVAAGTIQLLGPSREATGSGGERVHHAEVVAKLHVAPRQLVSGRKLAVLPPHLGIAFPVADHLGGRHQALELGEPILDLLHQPFDHTSSVTAPGANSGVGYLPLG